MKLYTTQPGIQLYTGNFLQDSPARQGRRADAEVRRLCPGDPALPLQPLQPEFPSTALRAGEGVRTNTTLPVLHRRSAGNCKQMQPLSSKPDGSALWSCLLLFRKVSITPCSPGQKSLVDRYAREKIIAKRKSILHKMRRYLILRRKSGCVLVAEGGTRGPAQSDIW